LGGAVVTHTDISERKLAEQLLTRTVRRFETVLSNIHGAILLVSPAGRIEFANPVYCEYFGLRESPETLVGMSSEEMQRRIENRYIDPERSLARIRELVSANQEVRDEEVTLEGGLTLGRDFVPFTVDGISFGRLWFHRDITERSRMRDSLREMSARMEAIIDASMDAIISVDQDERIVVFNAAAERMFSIAEHEAIGQPLELFIPERYRSGHHSHMRRFRDSGVTVREMGQFSRVSALHADGTEFPIEASISNVSIEGSHLYTVTLRDISEKERAESMRASLEAQVRESQKIAAVGTLAGGIAHDFNNILAAILGNAQLALEDTGNPKVLESVREIIKAGVRGRDLVQQILSFSRRQITDRKLVSLGPIVQESLRLLRLTLPSNLTLEASCAPATPLVLADSTQIGQIILNLAHNAIQAMRHTSGRIEICVDTISVEEAMRRPNTGLRSMVEAHPGEVVRLAVRDTGPGMDAALLERIFEPFFTTKPVGEGTGLGLSVVHGIVQAHEGAIEVDSAPGKGTTFLVYLPAARVDGAPDALAASDRSTQTAEDSASEGRGRRILYLDDDEALTFLVTRLLERRGYKVEGYTDQRQALAALRANPAGFDLVVTDYNMPGMSGIDVAREVRAIRADLPLAIASGFVNEALHTQAAREGLGEIIFKAISVEDYCASVQRLIRSAGPNR